MKGGGGFLILRGIHLEKGKANMGERSITQLENAGGDFLWIEN